MADRTIYRAGFTAWAPRLLVPAVLAGISPALLFESRLGWPTKLAMVVAMSAVGAAAAQWLLRQQVSSIVEGVGQIRLSRPQLLSTVWLKISEDAFRSARYEMRGTHSRPMHGLIVSSHEGDIFIRLNGVALATDAMRRLSPDAFAAYEAATDGGRHTELSPLRRGRVRRT